MFKWFQKADGKDQGGDVQVPTEPTPESPVVPEAPVETPTETENPVGNE